MQYSFRECTIDDFDFLFNLKKDNFKWYVDKIWGWNDNDQKQRLMQDLNEHLEHKRIIIVDGKPIGVYAVHITDDGDLFINEISILKEYQNKGIGRKILESQLKDNRKNGIRTILQVFKDNPAKKLYESLGFTVYGETETHYQMENIGGIYMIDHIAALIFNKNLELLVLRKKTPNNRKECILPGGKRENGESDEQTLRREISEELGVEIEEMNFYKQYLDKAVFEEGEDFRQTTYITKLKSNNISVQNEIKEALWIDTDYEKKGILCNPTLENKIIPDLIIDGYMIKEWKDR